MTGFLATTACPPPAEVATAPAHTTVPKLATFIRRLRDNSEGVAALEFGFLAPILMVMLICTIEVSRMVAADRRVQLATAMVADLVAREKKITKEDLEGTKANPNAGIYGVVRHVMAPYDVSQLRIAVTPVQANPDDADDIRVYATEANRPSYHAAPNKAKGATIKLEAGLIAPGSSAIVVETTYTYQPLFGDFLQSYMGWKGLTWEDRAVLSPRENCVDFDNNKCVTSVF